MDLLEKQKSEQDDLKKTEKEKTYVFWGGNRPIARNIVRKTGDHDYFLEAAFKNPITVRDKTMLEKQIRIPLSVATSGGIDSIDVRFQPCRKETVPQKSETVPQKK
jgi:hypothetical protein